MICYYEIENENGETITQGTTREETLAKAQAYYDDLAEDGPYEVEVKLFAADEDGDEHDPEYITIMAGDWDGEFASSDYAQHNVWNKAQTGVK